MMIENHNYFLFLKNKKSKIFYNSIADYFISDASR